MRPAAAAAAMLLWACAVAAAPLPRAPVPAAMARVVVEAGPEHELAVVENLLDGPVEVMLHGDGDAGGSDPPLPARATLAARSRALVAVLPTRPPRSRPLRLRLVVVPGDASARPRDIEYGWPLDSDLLRIGQAWGGGYSHDDDENRHAVDFAAPVGTPVRAARDGIVMQLEARFTGGGLDRDHDIGRANFVRILHEDGTMALYAHLAPGGVQVRQGDRVARGQVIARSGDTGYSGAPHLHFAVHANRGMRLQSIPFRMWGPEGILRFTAPAPSP